MSSGFLGHVYKGPDGTEYIICSYCFELTTLENLWVDPSDNQRVDVCCSCKWREDGGTTALVFVPTEPRCAHTWKTQVFRPIGSGRYGFLLAYDQHECKMEIDHGDGSHVCYHCNNSVPRTNVGVVLYTAGERMAEILWS